MNAAPPIGLNWLPAVDRVPANADLELASGFTVPLGFLASLGATEDGDLGVWWRLDAALASRPRHKADGRRGPSRMVHPAVLLRPCTDFVLDEGAVKSAFLRWVRELSSQRRLDLEALRRRMPAIEDLVLPRPPGWPVRRAGPLEVDPGAYRAHTVEALRAGRDALGTGRVRDPTRVWRELPWVAEQALREPPEDGGLVIEDCERLSLLDELRPAQARGRARAHRLPSLAGALYEALPDGRGLPGALHLPPKAIYTDATRIIAPLPNRFAYEVCMAAGSRTPWLARAVEDYGHTPSKRDSATRGLADAVKKQWARLEGRAEKHRTLVRRVVQYLVADTGVVARPFTAHGAAERSSHGEVEQVAELLLEWIRSDSCLETLELMAGGDRGALRFRCPGETWSAFADERWGALHLARVRVDPEDAGFRAAVGATPGADLAHPVDTWVCGLGADFDEVWERELGVRAGEVLGGASFSPSTTPSITLGG